jgi:hypothetical protein
MNQKLFLLIIIISTFSSCSYIEQYIKERESEGIIASVGDNFLYKEDIEHIVPQGTSSSDSALIVEAYIQRWATNILTLKNAERNVSNQQEINKMVEEYRQRLMIHNYQQEMVSEKVKLPTEIEAKQFYESNKELFLLEDAVIKGAIIKVPNNIKTDNIQRKFKNLNENIADIEKYALQYAKDYVLFTEYWKPLNEIIDTKTSSLKITKPGYYEEKDSVNLLLLNITDYIQEGEIAPIEMVMEEVRSMLYDQEKMEYLKNFDNEIYDYAIKHNQIKIKTEN